MDDVLMMKVLVQVLDNFRGYGISTTVQILTKMAGHLMLYKTVFIHFADGKSPELHLSGGESDILCHRSLMTRILFLDKDSFWLKQVLSFRKMRYDLLYFVLD